MEVVENSKTGVSYWKIPQSKLRIRTGNTPYGQGVFACDPIPAGTALGEVRGTIIQGSDYQSDYCMDLGENQSLEPHAPYRYVNHCCEPNCELYQIDLEDESGVEHPMIVIEASRDIAVDDQLTIDYAWPAEEAIPCGCGAESCRGYIVHPDERELAVKLHSRGA
ncbi:SET domain-containing protein [Symmachiella dynata]|uniref:SET domain-containing protein n=1 Tax=Symmachiella dynata TaxID=2527995 RepID=UPI0030EBA5A7